MDGNLQVPAVEGKPAKVIELPFYRQITFDERMELEEQKQAKIRTIETEYDETMKRLQEAIQVWRDTGAISDAGQYQNKLQELDAQRSLLMHGNRWTKVIASLSKNLIDFENSKDDRKTPYSVVQFCYRSLAPNEEIIAMNEKPIAPVAEEEEEEENELTLGEEEEPEEYIFFHDPLQVHGFLSPDSMRSFRFHNVQYNSPIQAFHGERLERVGRVKLRVPLLGQTTAKGIRTFASRVTGELEDAREVWIQILKEYIRYNPDLKEPLRETGNAVLAYANPTDNKWGIGLAMGDPNLEDRSQWTGENMIGEAWMVVRSSLESIEEASMEGGGALQVAKTQEHVQRRSGVLANMYKHKKQVGFAY